jgi:hypothetical protein
METLNLLALLALLTGSQPEKPNPSPAKDAVAPTQRPEDRPAHESPYSAFGAPHAKRSTAKKRSGMRLHCKDGTIRTEGQKGNKNACEDHGGVKQ